MTTLHITNGDCAAVTLRQVVTGPVVTAADVLHEGPCPPVDGDAWYETRARFLAGGEPETAARIKAGLAAGDQQIIDACARGDRLVLWFEHDLFDQLAIIRTLDLMVRLKPDTTDVRPDAADAAHVRPGVSDAAHVQPGVSDAAPVVSGFSRTHPRVSLICAGSFPGIDRFIGLGQLSAAQLATLDGTGTPLTAGHFSLAVDAWRAFRSPDPSSLLRLAEQMIASRAGVSEGGAALPFLGDALLRFLAEYPSAENGLSRTEELALQALLDGPRTAGALFGAAQALEARPFLGDLPFFDTLRRLAASRVPLVTIETGGEEIRTQRITITNAGRDVVARRADHIRLNGIDLWRGGVHLSGSDRSPWRWDASAETLIS